MAKKRGYSAPDENIYEPDESDLEGEEEDQQVEANQAALRQGEPVQEEGQQDPDSPDNEAPLKVGNHTDI